MIHVHVTSWFLGLVFFVVTYMLYKKNAGKKAKIFHMITRVLYLVILATGGHMFANYLMDAGIVNKGPIIIKGILGITLIGLMEIILVQRKRGEVRIMNWVFFFITFLLVLFYGYVVIGG
ncbi:YisL family protein [Fictibacillus barbaricus]|uniref:Membrane protein SirB2 n=1 Tax=Fictibacillus barbaricus TaxID=182136 RepID=A0ABU1TXQ1_9BACL|nr:YisL family protein [Fictibacillus barbaricus]MDR7071953.1 putative membrane protein SirB2 [Fictibacillus barbaricus]